MSSSVRQTKAKEEIKLQHNRITISKLNKTHYLPFLVVSRAPATMAALIVFLTCLVFVSAEHSGAYSAPQYAKKMYPTQGYGSFETNALLPREQTKAPFRQSQEIRDRYDSNNTEGFGRSSLLQSAGSFLSGAGGQVVSSLAKDFIARSTGSSQVGFDCISQVLSLNLTNLVILVVLKALILAAGFFGAGAWKGGHHYARSIDDNKNATYISGEEVLLYLSYLAGQNTNNYECLYRLACEAPAQAAGYYAGGEILLQAAAMYNGDGKDLIQYEEITKGLRKAATWGEEGMPCDTRYKCGQ